MKHGCLFINLSIGILVFLLTELQPFHLGRKMCSFYIWGINMLTTCITLFCLFHFVKPFMSLGFILEKECSSPRSLVGFLEAERGLGEITVTLQERVSDINSVYSSCFPWSVSIIYLLSWVRFCRPVAIKFSSPPDRRKVNQMNYLGSVK